MRPTKLKLCNSRQARDPGEGTHVSWHSICAAAFPNLEHLGYMLSIVGHVGSRKAQLEKSLGRTRLESEFHMRSFANAGANDCAVETWNLTMAPSSRQCGIVKKVA